MVDNRQNVPRFFATQWEAKRADLLRQNRYRGKLAEVFYACADDAFWADGIRRILYVGKATAGDYKPDVAKNFYRGCNHGAFWSLAERLGSCLNPRLTDKLAGVAWTNLMKIGTVSGNPKGKLVQEQYDLAVKTLAAEIKHFNPSLLVCVAANNYDDVVYDALGLTRGDDGFIEEAAGARFIYKRRASDGLPAVVWLEHPERKKRTYVDAAFECAVKLTI